MSTLDPGASGRTVFYVQTINALQIMDSGHDLQRFDGLHIEHIDSPVRPLARGSSVDMYVKCRRFLKQEV